MLTDIFAYRYLDHPIWQAYTEVEHRLLNQACGIVNDALPYYDSLGQEIQANKAKWKGLHDLLARELGVDALSKTHYSYKQMNALGKEFPVTGVWTWNHVCEQFVKPAPPADHRDPDRFIKERLSFIELALRLRNAEIDQLNARLPQTLEEAAMRDKTPPRGIRLPGSAVDGARARTPARTQSLTLRSTSLMSGFEGLVLR